MAAANVLPNESHATAKVSLLACLKKLSTATLSWLFKILIGIQNLKTP